MKLRTKIFRGSLAIILVSISLFVYHGRNNPADTHRDQFQDIQGYLEWKKLTRLKPGMTEVDYPLGYQYNEYIQSKNKLASSRIAQTPLDWKRRGPGNVAGRTRTVLIDSRDVTNKTWFIGSPGGGIWKTTDEGNTWTDMTEDVLNLAVVTIDQSKSNSEVFYAGTGEGSLSGPTQGSGVLKSVDGGDTWTLLESTTTSVSTNFLNTSRLIIDPDDENVVFAATSNGGNGHAFRSAVMKTIDGGDTWETVYSPPSFPTQIVYDPTDKSRIYVAVRRNGVVYSEDGGETWTVSNLSTVVGAAGGSADRTEFAISPSQTNTLYASVGYINRTGSGLFRSDDFGKTWTFIRDVTQPEDLDYLRQGEYDNCITVHPTDPNTVFWGGVLLYKSELLVDDIRTSDRNFLGADTINTGSFLSFVTFNNGTHFGNSIAIASPTTAPSLEIRFGPGKSQKAHRFSIPAGATSGVADANYTYEDFVDVPFEVWDTDNDIQLAVSFRDQEDNGVFNLNEAGLDEEESINREYVYLNNVPYEDVANPDIAKNGGHIFNEILFMWPTLTIGATWNPDNLPESVFKLNFGTTTFQNATIAELGGNESIHVDHHYLTTVPLGDGFRLFSVNDGGIGYSDNEGSSFVEKELGLVTAQFYTATKKPGESIYAGCLQDNDIVFSTVEDPDNLSLYLDTQDRIFADGFDIAWNRRNPDVILASYQRNVMIKSTNGGITWNQISTLTDAGFNSTTAPFWSKIAYSQTGANDVFAVSTSGVWRSRNFGDTWTLEPVFGRWGGALDVEVSDVNPDIVWAGGGMDDTRGIYLSTDKGSSFTRVPNYETPLGAISTIVPDPNDANTCYLVFSQFASPKILKTTDLGQSWENLSGFEVGDSVSTRGLANVGFNSLLVFPDGQQIWAGSEIGLFISMDAGLSWSMANNGFPNVHIMDMKVIDGEVIMATHGRGIWSVDLGLEYENQVFEVLSAESPAPSGIKIYPNPVRDVINFSINDHLYSGNIQLLDIQGRVLQNSKAENGRIPIDQLSRGTYILKVSDAKGEIYTERFIKN